MATLLIPFEKGEILSALRDKYKPENVEYTEEGTRVEVELAQEDYNRWKAFMTCN